MPRGYRLAAVATLMNAAWFALSLPTAASAAPFASTRHSAVLPPSANSTFSRSVGAAASPAGVPLAAAAVRRTDISDLGRLPATAPVNLAVTLQGSHPAELQWLVNEQGRRGSKYYHHFLTPAQYNAYFAPSPQAYARVAAALQKAGFHVTGTYANRTLIDAAGPAAAAEAYFATEIHRVAQVNHGQRYANVRAAVMPVELRGVASAVSGLSNVVIARPLIADNAMAQRIQAPRTIHVPSQSDAAMMLRRTQTTVIDSIRDGGFESGTFAYWSQCGSVPSHLETSRAHSYHYADFSGSATTKSGEITGDAGVCQYVKVPSAGVLSFWVYQSSSETDATYAYQEAALLDNTGRTVAQLYATANNTRGWSEFSYDLSSFAGKYVWVYFGVHGDGFTGAYTQQWVDDVSLTRKGATPSPTSTPPIVPTPQPTGSAKPTPTPKPTATPTAAPTPTPTATPAPTPTPTAAPSGAPSPIGGLLYGPDGGYGPIAVANGFDFPVQHGLNGSGRATGIMISGDYQDSDLSAFLSQFGVTRTGPPTTRVAIDGGATFGLNVDSEEATLDIETIASLAPGTHVYMYLFPDLSDVHIEDAYARAINDGIVDVLNSSFGGCEVGDPGFTTTVEQQATNAAALGMTFVASSGDSGSDGGCVSAPASAPHFVAVGGTSYTASSTSNPVGGYISESGWGGSGGGISQVYTQPSYQTGVAPSNGGRDVPDVSFPADGNLGTSFYFAGGFNGPIGGTSWSAPIFSALQTEINQRQNARNGFVNPRIYAAFNAHGYNDFHDITDGTNGGFLAGVGYDNVTGIGSPRGYALSADE